MKESLATFWRSPTAETRADRVMHAIIILTRLSLVAAIIWASFQPDLLTLAMSVLTLCASFVPTFVERRYNLKLPIEYHLVLIAFIYMSLFLGEVGGAYAAFWWWDVLLHGSSGVVLGYIGFLFLYILQARKKINLSPFFIALFSFFAAVSFGVFWEFFEFGADQLFGASMQYGNEDTMKDLIVDTIGAAIIAFFGYRYFKDKQGSPIERWVTRFVELNPRLVKKK